MSKLLSKLFSGWRWIKESYHLSNMSESEIESYVARKFEADMLLLEKKGKGRLASGFDLTLTE